MEILNASDEVIIGKFDGGTYKFMPDQVVVIQNGFAAKHILDRWGKYGLVEIKYDDKQAKIFDDYDEYVHSQKIFGITNQLETLKVKLLNLEVYDESFGDRKAPHRTFFSKNAKGVKKRIEEVEARLEKTEAFNPKKTPQQKADVFLKKAAELKREAERILKNGDNASKSA